MKFWRIWLLVCSLFFSGCEQSSKTAERTIPANQSSPDSGTIINKQPAVTPVKDSTALPKTNLSKSDSLNFNQFFSLFFQIIQQQDSTTFNQYIHPTYGLYIIEQPGAVPQFTKVDFIQDFKRAYQNQTFFSIKKEFKNCNLKEEALPTFNCDGQGDNPAGFTKQGCFVADANAFRKNEAHKYAGLSAAEIQRIEKLKPLLTKTVLHTGSAFQFHFGNLEGKWYVLFIQLIVPCSA